MSNSWGPWDDLLTLSHTLSHTLSDTNSVSFTDGYSAGHQIIQSAISNTAYLYAPPAAAQTAYVPNGLNQYATITPPGGSAVTPTYDANGNLTNDGKFSYSYDPENRLTGASETGMSATYLYDPEGRRREKQITGGSFAGTTQILDSGDDEIADYDVSGTLLRRYIPGRAVDEPIAMVTAAGAITYFHRDKTDSVVAMSDASGNLALINGPGSPTDGPYTYDAYGNCMVGGVACAGGVPFKYTGQRFDPETGLYSFRSRFYDPLLGRFLQTDPIGYADDIDWYNYAGEDPTDKNDPSGMLECIGTGKDNDNNYCAIKPSDWFFANTNQSEGVASAPTASIFSAIGEIAAKLFGKESAEIGSKEGSEIVAKKVGGKIGGDLAAHAESLLPDGMNREEFGDFVGWNGDNGSGAAQANESADYIIKQTSAHPGDGTNPIDNIQESGISREAIQAWYKVYASAVARGRGGAVAVARKRLMQTILDHW